MHSTHATRTPVDAHTYIFAQALITAANTQPAIAEQIRDVIKATNWTPQTNLTPTNTNLHLDARTALATTHWLTNTVHEHTHNETAGLLATWADSYQTPKDAVIGIVGIAIMGPTLGILDKPKKKKKAELPVIIEHALYQTLTKAALVSLASKLGQQVIAHELRLAGGNAYRLHPDTAEWSFEAGPITLYVADTSTYRTLQTLIRTQHLPHQAHIEQPALALSPAIATYVTEECVLTRVV